MRKKFPIRVLAYLVILALPFVAVPAAAQGAGEGDSDAAPLAPAAVLWNQISNSTGGVASQHMPDFGAGFYSADDFQNTGAWALNLIFVDGSWNGVGSLPDAVSLNWYIYADAGGVPAGHPEDGGGTEFWSYSCAPSALEITLSGANNDDVTLDIIAAQGSAVNLPPGHWWLVFFPSLDYGLYNQWWWDRAGSMNLVDAQFIDPSNLFGSGWIIWTSWYNVVDPGGTYDLAFRLEGMLQEEYEGGDAPDSRNHFGIGMTTYPSPVAANFPTVWDPGLPVGPNGHGLCHTYPLGSNLLFLGTAPSLETDADLLPDADTVTNITPPTNAADQDGFDDGTAFAPGAWNHCQPIPGIQVTTSGAGVVNIWVDWGRNGDWSQGTTACNCGENEWAAQNVAVPGGGTWNIGGPGGLGAPIVACQPGLTSGNPLQADVWMRTTLTPGVLDSVNVDPLYAFGGQSTGCFDEGETEDRYVTFGLNAVTLSAFTARPSRLPAVALAALAVVVPAGGMVLLRRRR